MPSKKSLAHSLFALVAGLAAAESLAAQTADRRAEEIAIISKPGDAAGTYRLSVAWGIDVNTTSTLPLGSVLTVSRNGTSIWTNTVGANAFVGGGCTECQAGTVCVCVPGEGCVCCDCDATNCACSPWFTSDLPTAVPLAAGDVLTFSIVPAPGAAPDAMTTNNTRTVVFNGSQSFWNRRVLAAELVPSACPGASNLYDLHYTLAYDMAGIVGTVELFGDLELIVNNVVAYQFDACQDNPWITTGVQCGVGGSCGVTECGHGSCAGANVDLDCQTIELPNGLQSCACSSGSLNYVVSGISIPNLSSSSTVKFRFAADATRALPELTLFDGDNSVATSFTIAPSACIADLNNDGKVDASDLAIVLGAWGECP